MINSRYVEEKSENIYILEEKYKNENGEYILHDVWEHDIEEIK